MGHYALGQLPVSDWFGATINYTHEDLDVLGVEAEAGVVTLAMLFTLTDNLFINFEYSHTDIEVVNCRFECRRGEPRSITYLLSV